jgi:hypothetical protein
MNFAFLAPVRPVSLTGALPRTLPKLIAFLNVN